jgi:hypothetical protein
MEALAEVMLFPGMAENIRLVNDPEFVAKKLRRWLAKVGDVVYRARKSFRERLL